MCLQNNVFLYKTILVTGSAGFIGSNLALRLMETTTPLTVVGLDNLNDYYDVSLKEYRLRLIEEAAEKNPLVTWRFIRGSIADKALVDSLFEEYHFDIVVNLAAQAGVRYSIVINRHSIESGKLLQLIHSHRALPILQAIISSTTQT